MTEMAETTCDDGIFVVGCQRSGTTLLRVILDSHRSLCAGEETLFLADMEKLLTLHLEKLQTFGLSRDEIKTAIRDFFLRFHHAYRDRTGKERWVDKSPFYVKHLSFVNELFPRAKVVHIIRDGRDVAASYREKWGRTGYFSALRDWVECVRKGQSAGRWLGADRYMEIRYEDLVAEPRSVLQQLMRFLDIEWDENLLSHHEREHATASGFGYERPLQRITPEKAGAWKKRLNWLERALAALCYRQLLTELGYEQRKSVVANFVWRWGERYVSAFGFVANRLLLERAKRSGR